MDTGEDGGVGGGSAVVIAQENVEGIGGGTDDGDGFHFGRIERQSVALVLEEDDGFAGGVEREFAIRGGVDVGKGELGPRNVGGRIEHAEAEARFEETADGAIDFGHRDEAVALRVAQDTVFVAAGEVGTGFGGQSGGLVERECEIVSGVEIGDGAAVGDNEALEAPLIAEKIVEESAGAGGFAENAIVSTHRRVGVAVDDGGAKRGSVGVVKIVEGDGNVEAMADGFRARVDGVVFGSGDSLQVVRILTLEASDEGDAEARGQKRIFTVGFLAASPARIAKDIDVGRPIGEAVVAAGVVVLLRVVEFGASLGGDDVGDAMEEARVPSGGEADGLGENGGDAGARDTVETFVPPVVGGDLQARNGGGDVLHLGDFFVEGHAGDEVVDAGVERERGVEIGRSS